MADPIRLPVLKALTALLEGISIANGDSVDLTGKVFRGRSRFGEDDPETMVSILEAPRQLDSSYAGHGEIASDTWTLLVQGWTRDDKLNPSDPVYDMAWDVRQRLTRIVMERQDGSGKPMYPTEYMLGRTIAGIQIGQPVVRPPTPEISSRCFFYLPVQVTLASA